MPFIHNFADRAYRLDVGGLGYTRSKPLNILADADYGRDVDLSAVEIGGHGYRWIRL
jgi:hypothetical protein